MHCMATQVKAIQHDTTQVQSRPLTRTSIFRRMSHKSLRWIPTLGQVDYSSAFIFGSCWPTSVVALNILSTVVKTLARCALLYANAYRMGDAWKNGGSVCPARGT